MPEPDQTSPTPQVGPNLPEKECPEELKNRAQEFFRQASEVAYTLNYDYAIELFLDGLSFWPDTVDYGHKPLRDIALRRQAAGGKKSSFTDSSHFRKLSGKDPKEAMLKAEYLAAKEPANLQHLQDMTKNALTAGCLKSAFWMANVLFELNLQQPKPSFHAYLLLRDIFVQLETFPRALQACQMAAQLKPADIALQETLRDLAAQATMQKGRYDSGEDFRESIKDRDVQQRLHDQELLITSQRTSEQLIADARKEVQDAPNEPGKINKLVELLIKTEQEDLEDEAVEVLNAAFKRTSQFRFKQRAGQIRIKQLRRQIRMLQELLKAEPADRDVARQVADLQQQLQNTEIDHYQACIRNYPTDLGLKYEYARRLVAAARYDDAIPLFQEARNDPRHRLGAMSGIGQCFFFKQWYADAIETFQQALEVCPSNEDNTAKDLRYSLGRAYEGADQHEEALKCFRKIAQIDFNYRDVRERVDALREKLKESES